MIANNLGEDNEPSAESYREGGGISALIGALKELGRRIVKAILYVLEEL